MSTQPATVAHLLSKLGDDKRLRVRAMFGEYALYADEKVVGLVCDDLLYLKILPASQELEEICEQDAPYPGAQLYYLVEEHLFEQLDLPRIIFALAASLPAPKSKSQNKVG